MSTPSRSMGERRFGRVNWLGMMTLAEREVRRFSSIWMQTVGAPIVTAGLFLVIFSLAIGPDRADVMGRPYLEFIVPGLMMMTVIQNAFANTSSSLMVAKVQGNIVDTLMPPLNAIEIVTGYLIGGLVRGLLVGVVIAAVGLPVFAIGVAHPLWAIVFVCLGSFFMGALGLLAAIVATRFDQMAAVTNFVVTPLSFLSGTFYSVEAVPGVMKPLLHLNPMFYLIDGARYGVLGQSDSSPWLGLVIGVVATGAAVALALHWVRIGYRLKA